MEAARKMGPETEQPKQEQAESQSSQEERELSAGDDEGRGELETKQEAAFDNFVVAQGIHDGLTKELQRLSKEIIVDSVRMSPEELAKKAGQIERLDAEIERSRKLMDAQKGEIDRIKGILDVPESLTEQEIDDYLSGFDQYIEGSDENPILLTPEMKKPQQELVPGAADWKPEHVGQGVSVGDQWMAAKEVQKTEQVEVTEVTDEMITEELPAPEFTESAEAKEGWSDLELSWWEQGDKLAEGEPEATEILPPNKTELIDTIKNNELSPDRKQSVEKEIQKLENDMFDIMEGVDVVRKDGSTETRLGLNELEKSLTEDFKIDLDKMALSPWARGKAALRSLFSPRFRRTMGEYQTRVDEMANVDDQLRMAKLELKDPKKYMKVMNRRMANALAARMRMKARSNQKPSGGVFTLKA